METISVAYLPITFVSALVLGVERGFFAEQGLAVSLKQRSVASIQFDVASYSCDFGFANVPAVLAARASGLHIKVIASAACWSTDPAAATLQVLTLRNSSIAAPKDLEWRPLAVDALDQLPHISVIVSATVLGVDPGKIRFVDIRRRHGRSLGKRRGRGGGHGRALPDPGARRGRQPGALQLRGFRPGSQRWARLS